MGEDGFPIRWNWRSSLWVAGKTIGWGVLGYLLSALVMSIPSSGGASLGTRFLAELVKGDDAGVRLAGVFLGILLSLVIHFERRTRRVCRDIQLDISSRNIVIHAKLSRIDLVHVKELQDLLVDDPGGPQHRLIALDATDPSEWWCNSMLGYLAVQAHWRTIVKQKSEMCRVFVWDRSAITSLAGEKILTMHLMLGFKTIVLPTHLFFRHILKDKSEWKDYGHEFVTWDTNSAPSPSTPPGKVYYGYESYWYVTDKQSKRERIGAGKPSVFCKITDPAKAVFYRNVFDAAERFADSQGKNGCAICLDGHNSDQWEELQDWIENLPTD